MNKRHGNKKYSLRIEASKYNLFIMWLKSTVIVTRSA